MVKLTITTPDFGEQSCELSDGRFTVGRASRNMLIIDDPSVSSDHCELWINRNEVILRDCGARNGTFVEGSRVQAQAGVKSGQTIRMGRVEARVEILGEQDTQFTSLTASYDFRVASGMPDFTADKVRFPITFTPYTPPTFRGETMMMPAAKIPADAKIETTAKVKELEERPQASKFGWMVLAVVVAALIFVVARSLTH